MGECPGCGLRKRAYGYYRAAVRVAITRSRSAGPLRIYRCPGMRAWHLTSNVGGKAA